MKEVTLKSYALIALGCLSAAAWAADVPEIPFDSVPNVLKLPADMYLGEVSGIALNSKKHIFVYNRGNTTGPAYGATASQLLEFGPDGKFIREIGKGLYAWSFAHDVRVDKDDNIWAIDKGSDMIIRFNPEGRVTMVFGRKKEASDEDAEPWKHPNPPLPAIDGQFRQPTDVAWDHAGQYFHQRRLHQFAGGEVRQERRLGEIAGALRARVRGNSIRRTASPTTRRATSMWPIAGTSAFRFSIRMGSFCGRSTLDAPVPPDARPWMGNMPTATTQRYAIAAGAPWTVCISPGPRSIFTLRTRSRDGFIS